MEYYDDYYDFSLGGKLSNKGAGVNNKKDGSKTCYSSKHVRRVTSISQTPKTK